LLKISSSHRTQHRSARKKGPGPWRSQVRVTREGGKGAASSVCQAEEKRRRAD
jgi:hypothetical protein